MLRVVFAENNRYDVFIDLILSIRGVARKGPAKASKLLPVLCDRRHCGWKGKGRQFRIFSCQLDARHL